MNISIIQLKYKFLIFRKNPKPIKTKNILPLSIYGKFSEPAETTNIRQCF